MRALAERGHDRLWKQVSFIRLQLRRKVTNSGDGVVIHLLYPPREIIHALEHRLVRGDESQQPLDRHSREALPSSSAMVATVALRSSRKALALSHSMKPRFFERANATVDQLGNGLRSFRTGERRRDQLAEGCASLRLVEDQFRQLLSTEFLEAVDGESGFARHAAYPVNA